MSDIVSALEATTLPSIALLIFLGVFFLVLGRLFMPSMQKRIREECVLPLEDGVVVEGSEVRHEQA